MRFPASFVARYLISAVLLGLLGWFHATVGVAETLTREGVHLRLTSDVADKDLLDDMVSAFDAAVPQWLAFWGLPGERAANWKINGYLMRDAESFRRRGDLPANLPAFENGFATPTTLWVHYQASVYYNRHLILHEGVHSLAFELFGGGGPSWYMEGTAEMLATHRDRKITPPPSAPRATGGLLAQASNEFRVNDLPATREESPMWGRYKILEAARDAGTMPGLASVLKLPTDMKGDVESYTWCWAAAMMLTAYPDTRDAFVAAASQGRDSSDAFTTRFYRQNGGQWPALRARWQVWLHDLEYGFDRERSRVSLSTEDPRDDGSLRSLNVDAARGWQSAGAWYPAGTVKLRTGGRCVIVAKESVNGKQVAGFDPDTDEGLERDWISTPAGVTVHWHRGFPIGQLQVCVLPIPSSDVNSVARLDIRTPTVTPEVGAVSGTGADGGSFDATDIQTIRIDRPSWLLFRVHDVPGNSGRYQRADNRGGYQVQISR